MEFTNEALLTSHISCIPDSLIPREVLANVLIPCTGCQECNPNVPDESFHCPFCSKAAFKTSNRETLVTHVDHHFTESRGQLAINGYKITICGRNCEGNEKKHYHCPNCRETYQRKHVLSEHYQTCKQKPFEPKRRRRRGELQNSVTAQVLANVKSNQMVVCPHCAKLLNRKSLTRHIRDKHVSKNEPQKLCHCVCIDKLHEIYAVAKTVRGPQHPLHVYYRRKSEDKELTHYCSSKSCGENSSCLHVRSVASCSITCSKLSLSEQSVNVMFATGLLSKQQHSKVIQMQERALSEMTPILVEIPNKDGSSQRYRWFSVYSEVEGEQANSEGDLSRTIVTVDTADCDSWCHCHTKKCIHKVIVKCFLHDESQGKESLLKEKPKNQSSLIIDAVFHATTSQNNSTDVSSYTPRSEEGLYWSDGGVLIETALPGMEVVTCPPPAENFQEVIIDETSTIVFSSSLDLGDESTSVHETEDSETFGDLFNKCNPSMIYNTDKTADEQKMAQSTKSVFQDTNLDICCKTLSTEDKCESISLCSESQLNALGAMERCRLSFAGPGRLDHLKKQTALYLSQHKLFPDCKIGQLQFNPKRVPKKLMPKERKCQFCGSHLRHAVLICDDAKLYTLCGQVITGFKTYFRQCALCHFLYRYQEYSDGIFNYDDQTLISINLALYLRQSSQGSVLTDATVQYLNTELKMDFSADYLQDIYMGFEALKTHFYKSSCSLCGSTKDVKVDDGNEEIGSDLKNFQQQLILEKIVEKIFLYQSMSQPPTLSDDRKSTEGTDD